MPGTSNLSGNQSIFFGDNASFDGTHREGILESDGQFWIGSTAGNADSPNYISRPVRVGTATSSDSSVTITYSDVGNTEATLDFIITGGSTTVTKLQANDGNLAPPIAGIVKVYGSTAAAGTSPVTTTADNVNTLTTIVQLSQALAATDATKVGLANFDTADFDVDANGFVTFETSITTNDGNVVKSVNGNWNLWATVSGQGGPTPMYTIGNVGAGNLQTVLQFASATATTDATKVGAAAFDSADFSVDANGFVQLAGGGATQTLTPDFDFDGTAATPVAPQAGNINLLSYNPAVANVTNTYNSTGASTGDMKVEHKAWLTALVVDPSSTIGTRGTFQTIAAALTAASSGDTIFIRSGTYTENLTLKAGVNLTTFTTNQYNPNVTILGKLSYSGSGVVALSGLRLKTNSDYYLSVTGSNNSRIELRDCFVECDNNTGIEYTTSNTSSQIWLINCRGIINTTGITHYTMSSTGTLYIFRSQMNNGGSSTTASNNSAGGVNWNYSTSNIPVSSSSTGGLSSIYSYFDTSGTNSTSITMNGTGNGNHRKSFFLSGSASSISIGSGVTGSFVDCSVASTNTNATTGPGTLGYSGFSYDSTSNTINTTTIVRNVVDGGEYKGRTSSTTPSAGMIGEQIRSYVAGGSAVSLTVSGTAYNITSISLTPGIWDVSCVGQYSGVAVTGTNFRVAISTTSATMGTVGDNDVASPTAPNTNSGLSLVIPQYRIELAATTTVYLVARAVFTVGTPTVFGRLSAVRVA